MKALLLRIGIDKGSGGCLAPVFQDGSFEYIPIPERCATTENRIYANLFGKNGNPLVNFIPRAGRWFREQLKVIVHSRQSTAKMIHDVRCRIKRMRISDLLILDLGLRIGDVKKRMKNIRQNSRQSTDKSYEY